MIRLQVNILLSDLTESGEAAYPTMGDLEKSVLEAWLLIKEDILSQPYSYRTIMDAELEAWH